MKAAHRVYLLSLIFASLCSAHACRNSSSESMHTLGRPVRSSIQQNWVEMTRADFLNQVIGADPESVMPDNSAIVKKLNQWVESFDDYFRSIDPEGLKYIPKPNLVVLNSAQVNAFVASTPVCYDITVLAGKSSDNSQTNEVPALMFSKKDQLIGSINPEKCLSGDLKDLRPIFTEFAKSTSDCAVTINEEKKEIHFSSECKISINNRPQSSNEYVISKKLVLRKIPNWFVVLSGIFTAMKDESSLVGVIAHELAHYYRSHGLSNPGEYDYFYTQPLVRNHDRKPNPDESLRPLGETVFRASTIFDYTSRFPDADAESPSAFSYLAIGDLARQAALKGFSSVACSDVSAYGIDQEKIKEMQSMPFGKPSDPGLLERFFALGRKCLSEIDSSDVAVDIQAAYTRPEFLPYLSAPNLTDRKKANYLRGVAAISFLAREMKPKSSLLVDKVFKDVEVHYRKLETEMKGILQKAYDNRLGQYTTEQEADDISAELLMSFGFNPEAAVRTYLNLLPEETGFGGFDLGKERCLQIYQNNWIDPLGELKIPFLPLGNYSENHHSTCYRAFNIHRELKTHKYSRTGKSPISAEKWDKMVGELTEQAKSLETYEVSKLNGLVLENCPFSNMN